MARWKKVTLGIGVALALLLGGALLAQSFPRPLDIAASATRTTGAEIGASGRALGEYRAEYRRWTRVLGIPVHGATGVQTAERTAPGTIDLTYDLSDFGVDRMRLREPDLVLAERSFGQEGGPGQDFRRNGNTIEAVVRAADGSTRELAFDYPVPVFEPSLLELPLALMDLQPGDEGLLAWSNFADADDHWLPFRATGSEQVDAAGRLWDTRIVRVAFPNGSQRDYWLAEEPPYKIRMVSYDRGHLVVSGWDLESVEVPG